MNIFLLLNFKSYDIQNLTFVNTFLLTTPKILHKTTFLVNMQADTTIQTR